MFFLFSELQFFFKTKPVQLKRHKFPVCTSSGHELIFTTSPRPVSFTPPPLLLITFFSERLYVFVFYQMDFLSHLRVWVFDWL